MKTAIVTGVSRGIGSAVASALADDGYRVIGMARRAPEDERILHVPTDVTDREAVTQAVRAWTKEYGPADVLVNNAGITRDGLFLMLDDAAVDAVLDTNLRSVFTVTKAVLRGMVRRKSGRIINISSVVGTNGNPGQTNYAASKAGIIGFTKSLAKEVATLGITVNAIAPGFIETPMTDALSEAQREAATAQIPMGTLGTSEDIVEAVRYLIRARYVTGQVLKVDGGMTI